MTPQPGRCIVCGTASEAEFCGTCSGRRRRAADLLGRFPEVAYRAGSPVVAGLRLDAAMDALHVAGVVVALDSADAIETTTAHLSALGRILPYAASGVPWSELSPGMRSALGDGAAGLLAELVATFRPPVAVPPPVRMPDGKPALSGCLFCGLNAALVDADRALRLGGTEQAARALWTPLSATTEALGGRRGQSRVSGFLCPSCQRVRENAGRGIGGEVLLKAATAAGVTLPAASVPVAWAVTGDEPGAAPWQHMYLR